VTTPAHATVTWTTHTPAIYSNWKGVTSSADGTHLAAFRTSGNIYTSADSGLTWVDASTSIGSTKTWNGITSSSDGTHLAATYGTGASGGIYTSADSGATWISQAGAPNDQLGPISSSADGSHLVTGAQNSYANRLIYTSSDFGVTWVSRTTSGASNKRWLNIASSSDGSKLAATFIDATGTGGLMTSSDSGVTWTLRAGVGVSRYLFLAMNSDGTRLVVGKVNGKVLISSDSGVNFTEVTTLGDKFWTAVASSSDGTHLALIDGGDMMTMAPGAILISSDSGATWTDTLAATGNWQTIAYSADGLHLAASDYANGIYTASITPATFGITYLANGATSGAVPVDNATYATGAAITVRANTGTLAKTGYTFAGWNTNAGETGTSYVATGADTLTVASAAVTLYAKWTAIPPAPTVVVVAVVAPMTPEGAPAIHFTSTEVTCSLGKYSQAPASAVYTLVIGEDAVSTHFSNALIPSWLVPWAGKTTDYGNATATSASWNIQSSWKGKNLSCLTLAYANNATGSTSVSAVVPPL